MKAAGRALLGIVAGMAVAFALVVAVEMFSAVVHPYPPDFDGDIPAHVKRYPAWVLAVVVPMWGLAAAAATWVATRSSNQMAGIIVALLLAWALIFNVTHLPYPLWFKVGMLAAFPLFCLLGVRCGGGPTRATAIKS